MGDGYIITKDKQKNLDFILLDDGEYPNYYAYNKISDKSKLLDMKYPLIFKESCFQKDQFENVGVASDGLRFILDLPDHDIRLQNFKQYLLEDREGKIKQLINREPDLFKDDVSICF